jgi:hypothetical protein
MGLRGLERVAQWRVAQQQTKRTLGHVIVEFWEKRLETDPLFTFQQLTDYVDAHGNWRPNSPGRILELLKKDGQINYVVEKASYKTRRASVYKAIPLTFVRPKGM